ncbi:hypothetical protein K438DRAFT_1773376 [Mycena galopus ATCC 62051]|nr:hypothetical protein K438DRAFT_1773376 [Mycena galopus ATCC 62051]
MPESQVLQAFAHVLQNVALDAYKSSGLWPDAFAKGTSNKPYQTLTLDNGDYSPSLEPIPVKDYDTKHIPKMAPRRHMIDRKCVPGPLQFAVHGKCLAIAAGYLFPKHALVCHFDLEGNLRPMKCTDFDSMVAECVKGNTPQVDGGRKQEQK